MKRKTQREIGMIEGIILAIDLARMNYFNHEQLEWLIIDSALTTKEMKKYGKDTFDLWKDDPNYWETLKYALKENDKKFQRKL